MKNLDFSAMEKIQGGDSGAIAVTLPLTGLIAVLGLGALLGASLGIGIGVSYSISDLNLPSLGSLPLGL